MPQIDLNGSNRILFADALKRMRSFASFDFATETAYVIDPDTKLPIAVVRPFPKTAPKSAPAKPSPKPSAPAQATMHCRTCGATWDSTEGVGCPKCVHGPVPEVVQAIASAPLARTEEAPAAPVADPPEGPAKLQSALAASPLAREVVADHLRFNAGLSDAQIADNIGSKMGRAVPPSLVAEVRAGLATPDAPPPSVEEPSGTRVVKVMTPSIEDFIAKKIRLQPDRSDFEIVEDFKARTGRNLDPGLVAQVRASQSPPAAAPPAAPKPLTSNQKNLITEIYRKHPKWSDIEVAHHFEGLTGRRITGKVAAEYRPFVIGGAKPQESLAEVAAPETMTEPPASEPSPAASDALRDAYASRKAVSTLTVVQREQLRRLWADHLNATPEFIRDRYRSLMGREVTVEMVESFRPE